MRDNATEIKKELDQHHYIRCDGYLKTEFHHPEDSFH